MPKGSCLCGDYTYEIQENPTQVAICHCKPCQKLAGSNGSVSAVVPNDQYEKLSGDVRRYSRKSETGKNVTNGHCANCNTLMFVDADFMPGMTIFKPGTLDDQSLLDGAQAGIEVYARNRPDCFEALKDAAQRKGQTE